MKILNGSNPSVQTATTAVENVIEIFPNEQRAFSSIREDPNEQTEVHFDAQKLVSPKLCGKF